MHKLPDCSSFACTSAFVSRNSCRKHMVSGGDASVLLASYNCGYCDCVCEFCGAFFWYIERIVNLSSVDHPRYNRCYKSGSVVLAYPHTLPIEIYDLYMNKGFLNDIRVYNNMFSMTYFGENVDEEINNGEVRMCIKFQVRFIIGLVLWVCKMCTDLGSYSFISSTMTMKFIIERIYLTPIRELNSSIIHLLMQCLTTHNEYVRTFKTAKEIAATMNIDSCFVHFYSDVPDHRYVLQVPGSLGYIVTGDDSNCSTVYCNPDYFIMFTCNVKWPGIVCYVDIHGQHDTNRRDDIIARVFEINVDSFIKFLKEDKTFGEVDIYLYTIEFQKIGLSRCHTLLWVASLEKVKTIVNIDRNITIEFSDPILEANILLNVDHMYTTWDLRTAKQRLSMYERWKI
ncbi:unnamed protein product [Lactuca saligna]|uniref:Helitron helicase-like domain-containing protein n=1 Tax=Lactuca saligna TaxID=75948 RepID=A0AA35URQ5_LACSI|nr:unnamed protein product [Lactuca saligna]